MSVRSSILPTLDDCLNPCIGYGDGGIIFNGQVPASLTQFVYDWNWAEGWDGVDTLTDTIQGETWQDSNNPPTPVRGEADMSGSKEWTRINTDLTQLDPQTDDFAFVCVYRGHDSSNYGTCYFSDTLGAGFEHWRWLGGRLANSAQTSHGYVHNDPNNTRVTSTWAYNPLSIQSQYYEVIHKPATTADVRTISHGYETIIGTGIVDPAGGGSLDRISMGENGKITGTSGKKFALGSVIRMALANLTSGGGAPTVDEILSLQYDLTKHHYTYIEEKPLRKRFWHIFSGQSNMEGNNNPGGRTGEHDSSWFFSNGTSQGLTAADGAGIAGEVRTGYSSVGSGTHTGPEFQACLDMIAGGHEGMATKMAEGGKSFANPSSGFHPETGVEGAEFLLLISLIKKNRMEYAGLGDVAESVGYMHWFQGESDFPLSSAQQDAYLSHLNTLESKVLDAMGPEVTTLKWTMGRPWDVLTSHTDLEQSTVRAATVAFALSSSNRQWIDTDKDAGSSFRTLDSIHLNPDTDAVKGVRNYGSEISNRVLNWSANAHPEHELHKYNPSLIVTSDTNGEREWYDASGNSNQGTPTNSPVWIKGQGYSVNI